MRITHNNNKYHYSNLSFGNLKKVKFNKYFNPQKSGLDYLAVYEFMNSKAFRFLFENADVKASFKKIYYNDSDKISSCLDLTVTPHNLRINQSDSFLKKCIYKIQNLFGCNKKHMWIGGWEKRSEKKSNHLYKKLKNITIDDIETMFFK